MIDAGVLPRDARAMPRWHGRTARAYRHGRGRCVAGPQESVVGYDYAGAVSKVRRSAVGVSDQRSQGWTCSPPRSSHSRATARMVNSRVTPPAHTDRGEACQNTHSLRTHLLPLSVTQTSWASLPPAPQWPCRRTANCLPMRAPHGCVRSGRC